MLSVDLTVTFYALLGVCVVAAMLTGSTLQWIWVNGRLNSQYNVLVTIAAVSSLIQTVCCYVNALMAPDTNLWFMIYILINWVFMTHSSVLLVSKKLSLTFIKQEQKRVWHRLLLINACMFPISIFTCVYWSTSHNFDSPVFTKINKIMEPLQIALWGVIEFCLSGAFIAQMWKYKWTAVERKAIYVLILVSFCDILSVLLNIFLGDLESTSVKGFVYCLRIRLEVAVLGQMVDYVRKRQRGSSKATSTAVEEPQKRSNAEKNDATKKTGSTKKVGFQFEEGEPKTRERAADSFAMMTLTQVMRDEDDDTDDEDENKPQAGQPGTREPAPNSFFMMTLTQVMGDDDDITDRPLDNDVEAGSMLPTIESECKPESEIEYEKTAPSSSESCDTDNGEDSVQ
jgi:hypothetical protein